MQRILSLFVLLIVYSPLPAAESLASWNDTASKSAIVEFVERVTDEASPNFVPPAERIAVFDNDGTLWSEQPIYFQLVFAVDRVKQLAPQHPEWKNQQPFKAVIENDRGAQAAFGGKELLQLVMSSHAGMTSDDFTDAVNDWLRTARHPRFDRPYTELVYLPMLQLLTYLRANGFKTFIVSGGGIDFMRVFSENVYGIPPEQVVGSSNKTKFELRDGVPVLVRLPQLDFIDDKEGKPVGINQHIGRRPIFAAGNSDGDLQMLQYTTIPRNENDKTLRFGLIVHHTDTQREWAYDHPSKIGQLDKALDEAKQRGWTVVDMKQDWKQVFPSP